MIPTINGKSNQRQRLIESLRLHCEIIAMGEPRSPLTRVMIALVLEQTEWVADTMLKHGSDFTARDFADLFFFRYPTHTGVMDVWSKLSKAEDVVAQSFLDRDLRQSLVTQIDSLEDCRSVKQITHEILSEVMSDV